MNKSSFIICAQQLVKTYADGAKQINVLQGLDFTLGAGESVAIVGPSGSGKSTLLHLLGGLDQPSTGQVCIEQHDLQTLSERQRCQIRNCKLGFVYQFHHLLPEFTALENVAIPLLIAGQSPTQASQVASDLLSQVGLAERLSHKPAQLSGGERQRTAIARALVHQPQCLLADEPTGNLDHHTANQVFASMQALKTQLGTSLIIATHDMTLAQAMDRMLLLEDGVLRSLS
ncbi:MAG: lipoprotein-releasing ABC transporter ATP-binding protein LolD [Legionellales bacterium]|nr:lipoprotein-releasing ABC transporter ATP-binding protein LolD [Legionellales bacterium]